MSEPSAMAGMPIPAEVLGPLAETAARMAAACSIDVAPTEAAAVATTQGKALQVLFGGDRTPGIEQLPVYVITMKGRFRAGRRSPFRKRPPEGTVVTATFNARTLTGLSTKIGHNDDRALLPQLGPVSILRIG